MSKRCTARQSPVRYLCQIFVSPFKEPRFGTWAHTFGCNLPMAFFWQMFYCGPLSRLIFRTLFKKQLAAQNTPAQGQK